MSRYRTRGIFITSSNNSSSIESRPAERKKKAPLMGHVGARVRVAPLLLVNSSCDREHAHTSDPPGAGSSYCRVNPWKAQTSVIRRYAFHAAGSTENSPPFCPSLSPCQTGQKSRNKNARQYDVAAARPLSVPTSRSGLENAADCQLEKPRGLGVLA